MINTVNSCVVVPVDSCLLVTTLIKKGGFLRRHRLQQLPNTKRRQPWWLGDVSSFGSIVACRELNTASQERQHGWSVKFKLDKRRATQTVDDHCCHNRLLDVSASTEWDESGTKPISNMVHVPEVRWSAEQNK